MPVEFTSNRDLIGFREELASLPKSRDEAIRCGGRFYFTNEPCARGHVSERYVSSRNCAACTREKATKRYKDDPEADRKRTALWREGNRRRATENALRWAEQNREKRRKIAREWARQNRPRYRAYSAMQCALRKRRLKQRTPKWVSPVDLLPFYEEARRLQVQTGTPHHVDHIIPISGEKVCGLHVPANLRVVSAHENQTKYNKLIEDLACEYESSDLVSTGVT